jgi:ParB family chromosome partitioning protein
MDIIEIATDLIDEDTDQPRYQFDEEALQELMKSIEELGLLSPIKVRTTGSGRYKIIYGNRRYKASKMLGRPTIPCIVSNVTDEMEIYLEQIAENLTREGFSPIEEAEAFHKLLNDPKFRSSTKFLSGKLGKPESYIKNKCELLKFGNAVKKLIVSGTEIRKDKLTEDQLLPLKDLPIEHRDPLALIVARDELPVSDVKKIAKLFKDKTITDSTKDKLLFKTGSGLIETWSTYEQNKAERSKPASEPKPSAKAGKQAKQEEQLIAQELGPEAQEAERITAGTLPIVLKLQKLASVLPAEGSLTAEVLQSLEAVHLNEQQSFAQGVDSLIENLEKHLAEWKSVRELTKAASFTASAKEN